jgi:hypothetical protein
MITIDDVSLLGMFAFIIQTRMIANLFLIFAAKPLKLTIKLMNSLES